MKLQIKKYFNSSRGYITLISILIVGAIGVAIAVYLILSGVGAARSGFILQQSIQSRALANACAEEALQKIRDTFSFVGNGTLNLGQGSCSYQVVNNGGENRTINASGSVGTVIRKIKITINKINPKIHVVSWQEVADF